LGAGDWAGPVVGGGGESAPMDEGRISMPYRCGKRLHDDTGGAYISSIFFDHVVSPLLTYFFSLPNFPLGRTEEKEVKERGKR